MKSRNGYIQLALKVCTTVCCLFGVIRDSSAQNNITFEYEDSTLVIDYDQDLVLYRTLVAYHTGDSLLERGYYKNGMLKYSIPSINGIINGECRHWYSNGNLKEISVWFNGVENGEVRLFFESGELWKVYFLADGIADGLFIEYYQNGQIQSTGNYERGEKKGYWVKYDESGGFIKDNVFE